MSKAAYFGVYVNYEGEFVDTGYISGTNYTYQTYIDIPARMTSLEFAETVDSWGGRQVVGSVSLKQKGPSTFTDRFGNKYTFNIHDTRSDRQRSIQLDVKIGSKVPVFKTYAFGEGKNNHELAAFYLDWMSYANPPSSTVSTYWSYHYYYLAWARFQDNNYPDTYLSALHQYYGAIAFSHFYFYQPYSNSLAYYYCYTQLAYSNYYHYLDRFGEATAAWYYQSYMDYANSWLNNYYLGY